MGSAHGGMQDVCGDVAEGSQGVATPGILQGLGAWGLGDTQAPGGTQRLPGGTGPPGLHRGFVGPNG